VDRLSKDGGAAAIPALNGLGGIGKSALAIHVAHRLKASYPAGQLFLELGGTSDTPLTPGAAMMQVILSVHPTAQLPNDETSVTAIYRDLLSSTKYLLVLDNARDAAQVSPLLQRSPCIFSIWRVHINP
jgi:predicted ATPase